ncbi:MAG TPA: DUF6155 family protein, partial [Bacteroidota bacterium]|nr:DUF6155 family protein [Bacteroidota bacterium]
AFFPQRGFMFNLREGKKAISDFKKLGVSSERVVDLMLIYVEDGVRYTNEYGDISESFYNSVAGVYRHALELMKKEQLLEKFQKRAEKMIEETEGIGWGFHDEISDLYGEFYRVRHLKSR